MTRVVVIGSGIIGLSTAFLLALDGLKVKVITRNPEEATSWVAGGMLAPFSEGLEGVLFDFSYESLKEYPSFLEKVKDVSGQRVDFWTEGINRVALKGEEGLLEIAKRYSSLGYSLELLEPPSYLSEEVIALIHYKEEGWVDAEMLMDALLFSMERLGVEVVIDEVRVSFDKERVINLEGIKDRYVGDFYVFCTGAWSKSLLNIPVFPVKGQALKVRDVLTDRVHYSSISYIIPRSRYTYVGATSEENVFTNDLTLGGIKRLCDGATKVIPKFKEARFMSGLVGFRPATRDSLPVLDLRENYMILTGHYRNGILHAPITAKVARDYLVDGKTSEYFKAFSLERFSL